MPLILSIRGDQYLVDLGFGEFAFSPIKIEADRETNDVAGIFKIELFDDNYKIVKKKNTEGKFIPEYKFSEKERQTEEFYPRCYYHQTSNESHFTQKRICSLPTQNGRITLVGNTLKITEKGVVTERQLNNEQEVQ